VAVSVARALEPVLEEVGLAEAVCDTVELRVAAAAAGEGVKEGTGTVGEDERLGEREGEEEVEANVGVGVLEEVAEWVERGGVGVPPPPTSKMCVLGLGVGEGGSEGEDELEKIEVRLKEKLWEGVEEARVLEVG